MDAGSNQGKSHHVQVIELYMMDKKKYFPLTILSGFTIRSMLYPFNLIRTRLQVQKHNTQYTGTIDAFRKIWKFEGMSGLYKGFWVNQLLMVSQMTYISTYETVRTQLKRIPEFEDKRLRSFIAGGCASCASQTFMVPVDVVAQHLQTVRAVPAASGKILSPLNISTDIAESRFGATSAVVKAVYKQYGIGGFYRGYFVSLAMYSSSSALWWLFYDSYCDIYASAVPDWVPRLAIQVFSGPSAGVTACVLTNPLDLLRVRVQVKSTPIIQTCRQMVHEERLKIFTKGLSARLVSSITFSFFIVLGYESIKRLSLLQDYKHEVRW